MDLNSPKLIVFRNYMFYNQYYPPYNPEIVNQMSYKTHRNTIPSWNTNQMKQIIQSQLFKHCCKDKENIIKLNENGYEVSLVSY